MALPLSISDAQFAYPHCGPWKIGSSYYMLKIDASTPTTVKVLKASDPTSSWAEDGTSTLIDPEGHTLLGGSVAGVVSGTTIHIFAQGPNASNASVLYASFNTSTSTWGTLAEPNGANFTDNQDPLVSGGVRSDGDVLFTCTGVETVMGTDYPRIILARLESGSWTGGIDAGAASKVAVSHLAPIAIMANQTNDRFHIIYVDDTNGDLKYSTYLSDNTWGHQNTTIDSAVATSDEAFMDIVAFGDAGTTKIRATYKDTGGISIAGFSDADSPSASVVATAINDNANPTACALAVDGTTQHLLYTVSSSANIYHSETGAGDDTWATDDTELTVGASPAVVFSANVYDSVLAYLYTDNGAEEYNERTLSSAATIAGAQTLQSLAQAGAITMQPDVAGAQTLSLLAQAGSAAQRFGVTGAQTLSLLAQTGAATLRFSTAAAQALQALLQSGAATHTLPAASVAGAQSLPLLAQNGAAAETISAAGAQLLEILAQAAAANHVSARTADGAQTLSLLAQDGAAAMVPDAVGDQTLELLAQAGSVTEIVTLAGEQTLELLAQAGAADLIVAAAGGQTLPLLAQSGVVDETISGAGAQLLQILAQAGAATSTLAGHTAAGTQTLPLLAQAGASVLSISGSGGQLLQLLRQAGAAALIITGAAAQTLQLLAQSGSAKESAQAAGAQVLPLLLQSGASDIAISAAGAQAISRLLQSGAGAIPTTVGGQQVLEILRQAGAVGGTSGDVAGAQTLQLLSMQTDGWTLTIYVPPGFTPGDAALGLLLPSPAGALPGFASGSAESGLLTPASTKTAPGLSAGSSATARLTPGNPPR